MPDLATTTAHPADIDADLLVLAVREGELEHGELLDGTDARVGGVLKRAAGEERFRAKLGQTLVVHVRDVRAQRIALVGLGAGVDRAGQALRIAAGCAARIADGRRRDARRLRLVAAARVRKRRARVRGRRGRRVARQLPLRQVPHGRSRSQARDDDVHPAAARRAGADDSERAFARARSTARAVSRARDLVNEPAGTLTPTALAETATAWAREAGLSIEVFDRAGCAALGMGLYLAVAQGSTQEPRFIHLAWTPPGARRRIVIVGKGITFDSGGLSLKTNEGMLDMKTDMAGAAAVLAAAASVAEEKLPVEVHALAACTENMPSGTRTSSAT